MGEHTATADRWWHHIRIPPGTRARVLAVVGAVAALLVTLGVIDAGTQGMVQDIAGQVLHIGSLILAVFGLG